MELATGVPEYRGSLEGQLLVAHPKSHSELAGSSLHIASYTAQCLRDGHECCDGMLRGGDIPDRIYVRSTRTFPGTGFCVSTMADRRQLSSC